MAGYKALKNGAAHSVRQHLKIPHKNKLVVGNVCLLDVFARLLEILWTTQLLAPAQSSTSVKRRSNKSYKRRSFTRLELGSWAEQERCLGLF
jgi:hypothetical protein